MKWKHAEENQNELTCLSRRFLSAGPGSCHPLLVHQYEMRVRMRQEIDVGRKLTHSSRMIRVHIHVDLLKWCEILFEQRMQSSSSSASRMDKVMMMIIGCSFYCWWLRTTVTWRIRPLVITSLAGAWNFKWGANNVAVLLCYRSLPALYPGGSVVVVDGSLPWNDEY